MIIPFISMVTVIISAGLGFNSEGHEWLLILFGNLSCAAYSYLVKGG
ncbi:hypothetical protein NVP1121O_231 [Vibrio phage 1.121.O._10N.286.46.C4]|nr:hypothetical protein NVP1121O_231 [Vibrio phage 1.121.O._10N.286.46.C4]